MKRFIKSVKLRHFKLEYYLVDENGGYGLEVIRRPGTDGLCRACVPYIGPQNEKTTDFLKKLIKNRATPCNLGEAVEDYYYECSLTQF